MIIIIDSAALLCQVLIWLYKACFADFVFVMKWALESILDLQNKLLTLCSVLKMIVLIMLLYLGAH